MGFLHGHGPSEALPIVREATIPSITPLSAILPQSLVLLPNIFAAAFLATGYVEGIPDLPLPLASRLLSSLDGLFGTFAKLRRRSPKGLLHRPIQLPGLPSGFL